MFSSNSVVLHDAFTTLTQPLDAPRLSLRHLILDLFQRLPLGFRHGAPRKVRRGGRGHAKRGKGGSLAKGLKSRLERLREGKGEQPELGSRDADADASDALRE